MNKKNYISPVSSVHSVSTCSVIATSIPSGGDNGIGNTDDDAGVKGEKSGAGIWDLYNN